MIGVVISRTRVERAVRDSVSWWKEADAPDPIDHVDCVHAPDLVAEALLRRAGTGWRLGHPRTLPYPKPAGGSRTLISLDPIAEIGLRVLLDGIALDLARSVDDGVTATRAQRTKDGWRAEPWREAHRRQRRRLAEYRESKTHRFHALADLSSHYDTIDRNVLRVTLHTLVDAPWCLDELLAQLGLLSEVPGLATGLPTGPEISALLGTAALAPVDRRLRTQGAYFNRWSDDIIVPATSEREAHSYLDAIRYQVALLGQTLNPDKTGVFGAEEVPKGASAATEDENADWSVEDPLADLECAAAAEDPGPVSYALGGLRARRDVRGVKVLEDFPWVVRRFPKQVGRYLGEVGNQVEDWDFVIAGIAAPTTAENAAAQIHLSRTLPARVLSKDLAGGLFEHGVSLDRARFGPVADHLLAASSRATGKRSRLDKQSMELAVASGELNCRRALIGPMRRRDVGAQVRHGLQHLVRLEPDLRLTVRYVLAR